MLQHFHRFGLHVNGCINPKKYVFAYRYILEEQKYSQKYC